MELPANTGINEYAIKLQDGKQSPYGPIYSLGPVELETLKTYIETYLKTGLFNLLSLRQVLPFYLIKSQKIAFGCVSIIEVSITLRSKINTRYRSSKRP